MRGALLALSVVLSAPYQCGTEPDPRPREDSAPEALWTLAERFASENNVSARATTLRELIERYPTSRYAERARQVERSAGRAAEQHEQATHGQRDE